MLKEEHKSLLPYELYAQIEEICKSVQDIQTEAAGIALQSKQPDAAAHLNDVLQHTEDATMTILDTMAAIQETVDAGGADLSQKVSEHITRVYEACNFQDVSGQRIQKVLANWQIIENRLSKLSEMAKSYGVMPPATTTPVNSNPLLNGPQLAVDAPDQASVDALFGSSKG
jgi:chemotaxis protein CheZ